MFQKLFLGEAARRRHCDAPFADERERYLQHCANLGATRATLRVKSTELLWLAGHLDPALFKALTWRRSKRLHGNGNQSAREPVPVED